MTKNSKKKLIITYVTVSILVIKSSIAAVVTNPKPVDGDYLKLLDSLKNYIQTSDIEKVSNVNSKFYTKDAETMGELQKKSSEMINAYLKTNSKQSNENTVLIKSLEEAYGVSRAKLEIQKAAAAAFDQASKEAIKLDKEEKVQEAACFEGLSNALTTGNTVSEECEDQNDDENKKYCFDELNACSAEISSHQKKFKSYLIKREKLQPSKAGYVEVNKYSDELNDLFSNSSQVCSRFSASMAIAEGNGGCLAKLANDKVNESYQNPPPKTPELGINAELDSYVLIPKHRAEGWAKYLEMANEKIAETEETMKKIQTQIANLSKIESGSLTASDLNKGESISEDDKRIGIYGRNGVGDIPVGLIKKFFAGNPTPEQIIKKAAELQLSKEAIALAMDIAGYGGKVPLDLDSKSYNYFTAGPKAIEKYGSMIDQLVAANGGRFEDIEKSYKLTIPGVMPIDTNSVFSPKGIISPESMNSFFQTKPTDKQLFSKMVEYGLKKDDLYKILSSQNLLHLNGDARNGAAKDSKGELIFNRLDNELYSGSTGYGVINPNDPNPSIVEGTGHIWDNINNLWIPFGFNPKFLLPGEVQTQAPKVFIDGGILQSKNALKKK